MNRKIKPDDSKLKIKSSTTQTTASAGEQSISSVTHRGCRGWAMSHGGAGAGPTLTSAHSSGPLGLTRSHVKDWVEMLENGDSRRAA